MQLGSLCLVTLFGTLETLANRCALSDEENNNSQIGEHGSIWKSPTVKMILSYANSHRVLYEQPTGHSATHGHKSSSYCSQMSKYQSLVTRYNILNLKSRICGYDSKTFEKQCAVPGATSSPQMTPTDKQSKNITIANKRQYLCEDFNYQDRLYALVFSRMSSTESADVSPTVELEQCKPFKKAKSNLQPKTQRTRSFHLSLEDLSRCDQQQDWITLASLKYTSSDSRLFVKDPILVMDRMMERELSYNSGSSVFEYHGTTSSDSSFSDDKTADDYSEGAMGRARILMFGGQFDGNRDANLRHFERALSHIFIRKLRLLLPELVMGRNLVLVDDCIQLFASNYCKGKQEK